MAHHRRLIAALYLLAFEQAPMAAAADCAASTACGTTMAPAAAATASSPGSEPGADAAADPRFAETDGAERARKLRRRPDEKSAKNELSVPVFGRPLTLGGGVGLALERRIDYALGGEPDDLLRKLAELDLEVFYPLSEQHALFFETVAIARRDHEPETREQTQHHSWRRGEMWLFSGGWFGDRISYQLGRQSFNDDREWWWDAELDAARIHYDTADVHVEVAIAEELARTSNNDLRLAPDKDKVLRLLASATHRYTEHNERSLFLLVQRDRSRKEAIDTVLPRERRDVNDLDAVWLGYREEGRRKLAAGHRLYYWLDAGAVWGEERVIDYDPVDGARSRVDGVAVRRVRGGAFDIGLHWQTPLPGRLAFTAGYALGSGDGDPDDGNDGSYRQSGLQDNDDKFRGVTGFRYYGDLLRPELSNLAISTLGVGFRFLGRNSLDLVFHTYRQIEPYGDLRGARLDSDPDGIHADIGSEANLVLGIEEWDQWEFEMVVSQFRAGAAYGARRGERADKIAMELSYRF